MATFVLVHGAWHGAWCWYKLIARLEARGHRALAPDLPGSGRDRSNAAPATYRDYVGRITEVLQAEPEPVVLVGHSMGGAIITGAAEAVPGKVAKLAYLCAFLGLSGRSTLEHAAGRPTPASARHIVPSADGLYTTFRAEGLREAFYADCSDDDVALARLCLTPQSMEPMTAPIVWTAERFGRIPRAYIACSEDTIRGDGEDQRALADVLPGEFVTLKASHSPFFSIPDLLADTLERLSP
jgi:pimeloyl-ACP methyl ester carboxylesterase